ncbi:MAG: alpha/beta hydrolase [Alphaproteobacteria bacterium]|nr:alpha/beta hydrolase [Alphaproteobacteria bacterium]|tara:strand:+ start:22458 stop:23567 length:1110 start_codon:yes stop_codon:yes gene_type:complete
MTPRKLGFRAVALYVALAMNASCVTSVDDTKLFENGSDSAMSEEAPDKFWIPDTISPAAKAKMEALVSYARAYQTNEAPAVTPEDWQARRQVREQMMEVFNAPLLERLKPSIEDVILAGIPALKVTPNTPRFSEDIILYVHGGGFTYLSARSSLKSAVLMAEATGYTIYSIDYTLAPEAKWDEITMQVITAYQALLNDGHSAGQIGFFGDSAGGSIVAGSTLRLRDMGLPMPAALLLHSPSTDLSGAGDTFTTLAFYDPGLEKEDALYRLSQYAEPDDLKNPYASPVYGDFSIGFPPTLIQTGTREMLLSDSVRLYQAIEQEGGEAVLDLYEGMPHVFPSLLDGTPESDAAYARAKKFWGEHFKSKPPG